MEKINKRIEKMNKRIEIIKDFAKKMGYSINDYKYENCDNNRLSRCVELIGTADIEANPYSWNWYLDTYEEY